MPKTKQTKAFTLVEIVVAVSIFMLILGISMRSYLNLIDGQNQANLNRLAISEVKNIFQILENENHQKSLLYTNSNANNELTLISDDLLQKVSFKFENNRLFQTYSNRLNTRSDFEEQTEELMHSTNLDIKNLKFVLTPNQNPYDIETEKPSKHPKVQVIMQVANPNTPNKTFDLSTTFSNRKYQAISLKPFNQ